MAGTVQEEALKLRENIDKIYDGGKQAGWDEFWDKIQDYGNRQAYNAAFANWGAEYIRPKYKVVPTHVNSASAMFEYCKKLKKVEAAYFDFSQKQKGTTSSAGYNATFNGCAKLEEIEDVGLVPQNNYSSAFGYCSSLKTIAKMGVDENTKYNNNTFIHCNRLENLTIYGTIGQNNFNIQWSPLSVESMKNIISCLKNYAGTSNDGAYEVSFSEDCWTALEADSTAPDGGTWKHYVVYTLGWAI